MLEFKFEMRSVEGLRFEASLWLRGQLRRVGVSVWNVDSGGLVLDTTKRLLDFLPRDCSSNISPAFSFACRSGAQSCLCVHQTIIPQIPAADTRAEAAPRPSTLEVRLLGPFRVLVDNQLIEESRWRRRKAKVLDQARERMQ